VFVLPLQGSANQQDMACQLIPATEWRSVHRWNFHVKADFLTDFMSSDLKRSTISSLPAYRSLRCPVPVPAPAPAPIPAPIPVPVPWPYDDG